MAHSQPLVKFSKVHPLAFSDASSATEYTSSESEEEATTQNHDNKSLQVVIDLGDSDEEVFPKVDLVVELLSENGVQEAKKELQESEEDEEASTVSGNYKYYRAALEPEVFPPDWSRGVICDMCQRGPSLSYGAWHSWCCGKPSKGCNCAQEDQQRKRTALTGKRDKNPSANINLAHVWSGKVHRLCALWSAEVYQNSNEPWILKELETAVRRSRKLKCWECGRLGATLGCRVKSCEKTYHYPCADRLSAFVKVSMWEGFVTPIACNDHRHDLEEEKQRKRKRGNPQKTLANEFGGSDEEEDANLVSAASRASVGLFPPPIGNNLLTPDFSYGCEECVPVPCTNDVDDEPPPYMEYITKTRFRNHYLGSKDCPQPPPERLAKACKGCTTHHDLDDPSAPLSIHVPFQSREDDGREDWLGERMYGRLPYDQYGRLLIGSKLNELVECNERCECGERCRNRELQKGLTTPVELYKTENKGWAVRTLVAIARGKFVVEYVGEMMTQEQFLRYGKNAHSIETKRSYTQELDYPESKKTPDFLLDSFHASNVSRFINHSCNPNMKLFRVYVETTYKWLPHIGFYAIRDIEAGEELAHDYISGGMSCKKLHLVHTEEEEEEEEEEEG